MAVSRARSVNGGEEIEMVDMRSRPRLRINVEHIFDVFRTNAYWRCASPTERTWARTVYIPPADAPDPSVVNKKINQKG